MFPDLPVGPYRLEAQLSGFNGYVQTGIRLEVSNNISINIALKLGEVKQQVEVTANANMVQTQTTSVAQVMDQTRILELPLNGRQATDLILLAGAATRTLARLTTSVTYRPANNYFSSVAISVAGGQSNGTNYLLDGGAHMDAFSDLNLPFPFPDALQEFSVQTSTLSARYGVHGGAVVNVVTKSGTNHFHGDAFEFVRNGDFNARDFFARYAGLPKKEPVWRHDWRANSQGQVVRLFRVPGDPHPDRARLLHLPRADAGCAEWRLQRVRIRHLPVRWCRKDARQPRDGGGLRKRFVSPSRSTT